MNLRLRGFLLVQEIQEFVEEAGGSYEEWYIGISYDAEDRLKQHGADESVLSKSFEADSEEAAREVEKHLQEIGMDGSESGGVPEKPPTQVYVYRKEDRTNP